MEKTGGSCLGGDTLEGVRPALSSAFYLRPGQPGLPGGCGRGRDTGTIHPESGVACVPVETAGPTLGVHFSTCPPSPCPRLRSKMGQAPAYTVFLAEIERKGGPPGLGERQRRRMGHWEIGAQGGYLDPRASRVWREKK